jgi:HSP20 family molecular chaperone IbpA
MKPPKVSHLPPQPAASRLEPCDLEGLRWDEQEIQLAIARRAYELFEARGGEHGHDWEDWFRAESELLCPVSFVISEKEGSLSVRVNVYGFDDTEIKTGVERHRLIIFGQKHVSAPTTESGATEPADWHPEQILRVIDLPTEIDPGGAVIELKAGVLSFELPKATEKTTLNQAHAA